MTQLKIVSDIFNLKDIFIQKLMKTKSFALCLDLSSTNYILRSMISHHNLLNPEIPEEKKQEKTKIFSILKAIIWNEFWTPSQLIKSISAVAKFSGLYWKIFALVILWQASVVMRQY